MSVIFVRRRFQGQTNKDCTQRTFMKGFGDLNVIILIAYMGQKRNAYLKTIPSNTVLTQCNFCDEMIKKQHNCFIIIIILFTGNWSLSLFLWPADWANTELEKWKYYKFPFQKQNPSVLNWLIVSKLVAFNKTALTCLQTVGPPQGNTRCCLYQKQTQRKYTASSLWKANTSETHGVVFIKSNQKETHGIVIYQIFFGSDETYQMCQNKTL